jgi:predicted Fe-Mo cluster-binding NifX family protein
MNDTPLKIAVPLLNGRVSAHFGHPDVFSFVSVDSGARAILSEEQHAPPPHKPGHLPVWLSEHGVRVVLAGGVGHRAVALLEKMGIEVSSGVPQITAAEAVRLWLDGNLTTGVNACDHTTGHRGCGGHHQP